MNLGDILFSLNCDTLKNEIRKIEQIKKRIVQTKNGIYFNEICLKEGLHRKFSNMCIYIYICIYRQQVIIKTCFIKYQMTFIS